MEMFYISLPPFEIHVGAIIVSIVAKPQPKIRVVWTYLQIYLNNFYKTLFWFEYCRKKIMWWHFIDLWPESVSFYFAGSVAGGEGNCGDLKCWTEKIIIEIPPSFKTSQELRRLRPRVPQKIQKSEFCYATNPSGFHRLDEPPEKKSAL